MAKNTIRKPFNIVRETVKEVEVSVPRRLVKPGSVHVTKGKDGKPEYYVGGSTIGFLTLPFKYIRKIYNQIVTRNTAPIVESKERFNFVGRIKPLTKNNYGQGHYKRQELVDRWPGKQKKEKQRTVIAVATEQ